MNGGLAGVAAGAIERRAGRDSRRDIARYLRDCAWAWCADDETLARILRDLAAQIDSNSGYHPSEAVRVLKEYAAAAAAAAADAETERMDRDEEPLDPTPPMVPVPMRYPRRIEAREIDAIAMRATYRRTVLSPKSVAVTATLANGFELTEIGSCLHPKDFDENTGAEVALSRIKDRLWALEGYHRAAKIQEP